MDDNSNVKTICWTIVSIVSILACLGAAMMLVFKNHPEYAVFPMLVVYGIVIIWGVLICCRCGKAVKS